MKQLDFDRAFPQTPDCIHAAIEMGIRKGQKKMKMRNKIITFGSIAAALAIMFAAALATGGLNLSPQPDVLAQPPVTDVPKSSEEPMVWCTEKGNYYHSEQYCSGMEGAIYGTLSYALALDKGPCPVCIAVNEEGLANDGENITVYAAYGQARYYHKTTVCNGQENKRELTLADANAENLDPCPDCYGAPIAEENEEETDVVFYCTPSGKYYHLEPDCSGMRNAEAHTLEQILANSSKYACPTCFDTDEKKALLMLPVPQNDADEVFVSPENNYYHRSHGCFYMGSVSRMDLKSAKGFGHTPCPMCLVEQVNISSFETCWATKNGKYYHSDEHCSGMQNAISGLTEQARSLGKLRCPVCMKTTPENYDLFTTAFGQEIEDLYSGYIYEYTIGSEWFISNGTENFELCEVYPEGTAFFGEELPGIPELHLTGLTADPKQVHEFMKSAPTPIGSMYATAAAEVEKQVTASNGSLNPEEVQQLQQVVVYFDANRQVSSCEMQFGFYDHVKLAWKVGADGQIELTEGKFVKPGWDWNDSSEEAPEETAVEVSTFTSPLPDESALPFLGTTTLLDVLYQSAFGNLEEASAAAYGFMQAEDAVALGYYFDPEEYGNSWLFTDGRTPVLNLYLQEADNDSNLKYIMNVELYGIQGDSKRFMESVAAQPLVDLYPQAVALAREHLASTHKEDAEDFNPYVEKMMIGFDETYWPNVIQLDFRRKSGSDEVFGVEFTMVDGSHDNWKSRIIV